MSTKEKMIVDAVEIIWSKQGYAVKAYKNNKLVSQSEWLETELEAIYYANRHFHLPEE